MNWPGSISTYIKINSDNILLFQVQGEEIIFREEYDDLDSLLARKNDLVKKPGKIKIIMGLDELFVRQFFLPVERKNKIEAVIKNEILPQLPGEKDNLSFSFYSFEKNGKLSVFVFALFRERLVKYYHWFKKEDWTIEKIIPAGILTGLVHQELYQESLNSNKEQSLSEYPESCLVVEIETDNLKLSFFRRKRLVYIRSKKIDGKPKEEIKNTLVYLLEEYLEEPNETPVVLLCGDYSPKQQNKMSIDLFDKQVLVLTLDNKKELKSRYLSLLKNRNKHIKGQDFLSRLSQQEKQESSRFRGFVLIIVLILLVNGIYFGLNFHFRQQHLAELERELEQQEPVVREVRELERQAELIAEEKKELSEKLEYNYAYLPWLGEISRIFSDIDDEIKLEQINLNGRELNLLSGTAASATVVMSRLEESDYFYKLYFRGSINREGEKERFRIAGELNYEVFSAEE